MLLGLSRFSLCFSLCCLILRAVLLRHSENAFLRDRLFVLLDRLKSPVLSIKREQYRTPCSCPCLLRSRAAAENRVLAQERERKRSVWKGLNKTRCSEARKAQKYQQQQSDSPKPRALHVRLSSSQPARRP
jgi:hypothetical protein